MNKIKIFLSVLFIFVITFFLSFFALEYAKQKGNDEMFSFSNPYELVIKNVRIIDGTGGEVFDSNIGISKGIIKKVNKNIDRGKADLFDATGYTLIPRLVEMPEDIPWISRDLPGAMSRFPYYRIFFKTSEDEHLAGRSLQAVLKEGLYSEEDLKTKFNWIVLIAPERDAMDADNISSAVYKITGWRSETLEIIDQGKIQAGQKMEGILYLTSDINRHDFLSALNNEIQPLGDYYINGSIIKDSTGRDVFERPDRSTEEAMEE